MISKMKFINIVGPKSSFERIVSDYILDSEIEFENPMSALKNTKGFTVNTDGNPAEEILKKFIDVFDYANIDYSGVKRHHDSFTEQELENVIDVFNDKIHSLKEEAESLKSEIKHADKIIGALEHVAGSDMNLDNLCNLKYIKYRFGKLPVSGFHKLDTYLKDLPVYFAPMTTENDYVWGIYFVSEQDKENVDRIFASLYFERTHIDGGGDGTAADVVKKLSADNAERERRIAELKSQIDSTIAVQKDDLLKAYADIKYNYDLYNIRRHTTNSNNSFCLTGWVTAEEAHRLKEASVNDSECVMLIDKPETVSHIKPPTKLKNMRIFKPFEEFVRMYGVPNYNELDPTPFLAIVYTILFGIMFGDVGHGLCLAAIGVIMILMKKGGFLAKLLVPIGLSSTVFGFVYGSVFGMEGEHALVKPLWFTPFENSGTMMQTLIYAVIIGVALILVCMIFNIINGAKQKDLQKIIFSQNGIAGMVFYIMVLYVGVSAVMGTSHPIKIAGILIGVSLVMIFLQEPLGKLAAKKKDWMPKEKGGFFVEAFFETFEILLSFVTNTVSFLRVGAFALNHAGMMSVVVMFMYSLGTGGSIAVTLFGNLLVIGLEGLIVGIQVLRLGFYEMFSRFYSGDGREFKPINSDKN